MVMSDYVKFDFLCHVWQLIKDNIRLIQKDIKVWLNLIMIELCLNRFLSCLRQGRRASFAEWLVSLTSNHKFRRDLWFVFMWGSNLASLLNVYGSTISIPRGSGGLPSPAKAGKVVAIRPSQTQLISTKQTNDMDAWPVKLFTGWTFDKRNQYYQSCSHCYCHQLGLEYDTWMCL